MNKPRGFDFSRKMWGVSWIIGTVLTIYLQAKGI